LEEKRASYLGPVFTITIGGKESLHVKVPFGPARELGPGFPGLLGRAMPEEKALTLRMRSNELSSGDEERYTDIFIIRKG